MKKLFHIVRELTPPAIWRGLVRIRRRRYHRRHRTPSGIDSAALQAASGNLRAQLGRRGSLDTEAGDRWATHFDRIVAEVALLGTVRDTIQYAQSRIAYEHRVAADVFRPFAKMSLDLLRSEFPRYEDLIESTRESDLARADSIVSIDGRPLSNTLLFHLRLLLMCLRWVPTTARVCEIGGGYGALARLFLTNARRPAHSYALIDFPESLYFAEVFLRSEIPNCTVVYVDNNSVDTASIRHGTVILCPVEYANALLRTEFDLVVNSGSLQEMPDEWVDRWMTWLDLLPCRFFYSLNYFAQPLSNLAESENSWSPRLSRRWTHRLETFNPAFVRTQSDRNFAEIIAERTDSGGLNKARSQETLAANIGDRLLDGQGFLEAMNAVRMDPSAAPALLRRCLLEMSPLPKEIEHLFRVAQKAGLETKEAAAVELAIRRDRDLGAPRPVY
jgi:putative sugar O-methyltransferase